MEHEIYVSREKKNLGHRNAAALIKKAVNMALDAEQIPVPCLISVMLTDEEGIRRVNRDFRGIDRATDVLSFPLNELSPGAFDPELCEAQGEEFGHGFEREIMYLSVHSVLHLLGYDHVDEGEMKRQMRQREKFIMGD